MLKQKSVSKEVHSTYFLRENWFGKFPPFFYIESIIGLLRIAGNLGNTISGDQRATYNITIIADPSFGAEESFRLVKGYRVNRQFVF